MKKVMPLQKVSLKIPNMAKNANIDALATPINKMQPLCQICDPYYIGLFIAIEVEYLYKSLFLHQLFETLLFLF